MHFQAQSLICIYAGLGNCGEWNTDSDTIVAIGKALYDRNGGGNCNQVRAPFLGVTPCIILP